MNTFYCLQDLVVDKSFWLIEQEAIHCVQVLRLKEGDEVTLLNGLGYKAEAVISYIQSRQKVEVMVKKSIFVAEPQQKIHLFLAVPQNNILNKLIKQLVELGIWQITFINSQFSVAKVSNFDKLNKQMIEAMKQSQNTYLPQLNSSLSFNDAINNAMGTIVYGAMFDDDVRYRYCIGSIEPVSLFIGPEGGFSSAEKDLLNHCGEALTLGCNILRLETATVALIAKLI